MLVVAVVAPVLLLRGVLVVLAELLLVAAVEEPLPTASTLALVVQVAMASAV